MTIAAIAETLPNDTSASGSTTQPLIRTAYWRTFDVIFDQELAWWGAKMAGPKIEPHRITRPIQLSAAWIAGLVLIVGAFLGTATHVENPSWLAGFLGISAVGIVPLFIVPLFLLQTKFRDHLQDDAHWDKMNRRREARFEKFKAENLGASRTGPEVSNLNSDVGLEAWRVQRYQQTGGLFLVHTWRPSHTKGQVADVIIQLCQHGDGPLPKGDVEKVEYSLGPKFFRGPVIKKNKSENFRLEISAYGPVLCAARVYLRGKQDPLQLERYINFEDLSNERDAE